MNPIFVITDTLVDIPPKINTREDVRAIILNESKILLMYSNTDQMYGTPGGGITLNESKLDTLYRELLEEVGGINVKIVEYFGQTEEIRLSRRTEKPVNILTDYYHVDIQDYVNGSLEEHEEEMGLEPKWVPIDEAIRQNESALKSRKDKFITFFYTQTEILKVVRDRFGL
ncbi:MAG: NUDIX domain-containing protein [Firmicutes bacterium]|nr:NUDIX domain-containing protein [Bacillota bacterium]